MHRRHRTCAEVLVRLHGLLRIGVHVTEPPAWFVRPDRQEGQVDPGVPAADLAEPVPVTGVPGEVDPPGVGAGGGDDPAAPQGAAGVGEGPFGPVVGRHEVEADPVELRRFPPVELGDTGEAATAAPAAEPGGDEERGVSGQSAQGGGVEVVVVVVADDDGVHRRQVLPADADRGDPGRGPEDPPGPDGIGEDGQSAGTDDPAGVPGPGDGRAARRHGRKRFGGVREPVDAAQSFGVGPQGVLTGQPGHAHDTRERRGEPVREAPGPFPDLTERTRSDDPAVGCAVRLRGPGAGALGLFRHRETPVSQFSSEFVEGRCENAQGLGHMRQFQGRHSGE